MALTVGARLGSYEILGPLGAGGMGEVYRARDLKLGREVAIKVLPPSVLADPERVARFQREAQLLAALKHPHIATIHGIDDADGAQFLILELLEGGTLAQRLLRGRMPFDEIKVIARQIAEALESAHEKGIVHRDLKPSNIAFTTDGQIKVLDFGLAKLTDPTDSVTSGVAVGGLASAGVPFGRPELSASPTITSPALLTGVGMLLGTAAYMSPEQAKGRTADKRSDIWAFGCVLFEMLTGRRAFEGEDVSDTLAGILRGEPTWQELPADTPHVLTTLVHRCLERDVKRRIGDTSVIRFLIDEDRGGSATPATVAPPARARAAAWAPWIVAGACLVSLAAVVAAWAPWRPAVPDVPLRLTTAVGADVLLRTDVDGLALSPDGSMLAFVAQTQIGSPSGLYTRQLGQLEATRLAGTDDAAAPFFSPDGNWIAFFAGGRLKKIAATGGGVTTLCDAPSGRGGAWTADDTIIFAATSTAGLSRVSSSGGTAEPWTKLEKGESSHRWPMLLPGGKAVVYTAGSSGSYETAALVVQSLDGNTRKVIQQGAYGARYVSSGHIVYAREGAIFAAAFDANRLEMTGKPVPALEGVNTNTNTGAVQLAVSATGRLVYLPGQNITDQASITWLDQSGKTTPLRPQLSNWSNPAFSPDGRRLAMDISDSNQTDIWIYEWARDTLSRLTFDAAEDRRPVWTPDGSRITFGSRRGSDMVVNLYWQKSDGTGEAQRLTTSPNAQYPGSWSPDGRFFAFSEQRGGASQDILILPMEGSEASGWKPGTPTVFLTSPFNDGSPMFSPDGKWLAYLSNESGRNEIYVRPFPGPGGKWQISNGPADDPTWSPTSKELFFAGIPEQRIMVAPYTVEGASLRADKPRLWAGVPFSGRPRAPSRDLDIHPDGKRFAIAPGGPDQSFEKVNNVVFVLNIRDDLTRAAPPDR